MTTPDYGNIGNQPPAEKPTRNINPRYIVAGILIVLGAIFVFENTNKVRIRFLIPEVTAPLWVALLITLVIGVLIGLFAAWRRGHRGDSSHGH